MAPRRKTAITTRGKAGRRNTKANRQTKANRSYLDKVHTWKRMGRHLIFFEGPHVEVVWTSTTQFDFDNVQDVHFGKDRKPVLLQQPKACVLISGPMLVEISLPSTETFYKFIADTEPVVLTKERAYFPLRGREAKRSFFKKMTLKDWAEVGNNPTFINQILLLDHFKSKHMNVLATTG